jgi:hypothetical protein
MIGKIYCTQPVTVTTTSGVVEVAQGGEFGCAGTCATATLNEPPVTVAISF